VVNGVELGGGSIRIHSADVQKTVFEEVLQFIPPDMVQARFGYMLERPIRRTAARCIRARLRSSHRGPLCHTASIRHVIAFPKTAKGNLPDGRLAQRGRAKTAARSDLRIKVGEERIIPWPSEEHRQS